ncbi:4-coumarate--CoA ligase-like 7 [Mycena venus]|uniref:4-coumarate--CoA ligase-like 7 n=1 Tax=Mycena venus TaxID=2733690 RepID=A0A8H6XIJ1_9AGAR|nr:4-coumarate--CoA ligase-like 7 [Mycena venus]
MMKRYLNSPEATKKAITPDGWFKTGDVCTRDTAGYYHVVDRRKSLIKYKGFQVVPAELEGILLTHPEIADAAVIGVESVEQATEFPRAYVVHSHPEKIKSDDVKAAFGQDIMTWMERSCAPQISTGR